MRYVGDELVLGLLRARDALLLLVYDVQLIADLLVLFVEYLRDGIQFAVFCGKRGCAARLPCEFLDGFQRIVGGKVRENEAHDDVQSDETGKRGQSVHHRVPLRFRSDAQTDERAVLHPSADVEHVGARRIGAACRTSRPGLHRRGDFLAVRAGFPRRHAETVARDRAVRVHESHSQPAQFHGQRVRSRFVRGARVLRVQSSYLRRDYAARVVDEGAVGNVGRDEREDDKAEQSDDESCNEHAPSHFALYL